MPNPSGQNQPGDGLALLDLSPVEPYLSEAERTRLPALKQRALRRVRGRHQDAQDLLQKMLHRFLEHLRRRGEPPPAVLGWLESRLEYAYRDWKEVQAETPAQLIEDTRTQPALQGHIAEVRERLEFVLKTIELLSADDAGILRLRHVDRMSAPEIAETLGLRPAAARKRLSRATKRLHLELAKSSERKPGEGC